MAQLFVNFVRSELSQTVLVGGTTIFIDSADAALLPSFGVGDKLRGTLSDGITPPEIIEVTARTGGTLTITRALESTAAREWPAGTRLTFGTTAGLLGSALNAAQAKFRWTGTATGTNAYTLTVVGVLPVPTDGDEITFIIPNTNTTVVTLTVTDGVTPIGPFSARNIDGAEFGAGSFAAGFYASLRWVASVGRWVASSLVSSSLPVTAINDGPLIPVNMLNNGELNLWDLGTSFNTPATETETANNWDIGYDGAIGTFTISRQAFTPGQIEVEGQPLWFWRWDQTVAGSGSTTRNTRNRIKAGSGASWRNGRQVTMSVWLKADSPRTVTLIVSQNFGTGGTPSAGTSTSQAVSVTTAWQKFTFTTTLASTAGKTFGTNEDHFVSAGLNFPINTTMTIDVAMMQLEPGPRASSIASAWPVPPERGGLGLTGVTLAELLGKIAVPLRTALLTVDGAGSLLDADLLDALNSTDFVRTTGSVTENVTGVKTFQSTVRISNTNPRFILDETDGAADAKKWLLEATGGVAFFRALNDAEAATTDFVSFTRAGGTASTVTTAVPIRAPDGSLAAPSYSWTSDPDTGFMHPVSANQMDVVVGGQTQWRFTTSFFFSNATIANAGIQVSAGTAGGPTLSFIDDVDCGSYRIGADNIGFATGGVLRYDVSNARFQLAQPLFGDAAGSAAAPSIVPDSADSNTGLYGIAGDQMGITTGGVLRADFDTARLLLAASFDLQLNVPLDPGSTGSVGYRGAPVNTQNVAYQFVLSDAGRTVLHDETSARTWTIPANASVAFPIGTTIIIDNTGNGGGAPGALTITITTDTLRRGDGVAGMGNRTVAANAVAIIRKTKATEWVITGIFT